MKLTSSFTTNVNTKAVREAVGKAARLGTRDTIVSIASDVVKGSPILTGNNRRSIAFEVSGMGPSAQASIEGRRPTDTWELPSGRVVDDRKIEGAVYSTSGYGGKLETDGIHPTYFQPALDRNAKDLVPNIKKYMGQG